MKLISLDISTRSTGYCVSVNNKIKEYGTLASSHKDHLVRGNSMADNINLLVKKYGTFDKVVVEELKVSRNLHTTVMLANVQGLILRELSPSPTEFVAPTVWRKLYKINGKREEAKKKAISLVKSKGYEVKNDDEAEAILLLNFFIKSLAKTK